MNTTGQNFEPYQNLLRSVEWIARRKKILARDEYRCRNCGSKHNLMVHHRQYHFIRTVGAHQKPWQYADHDLITLCATCHEAGHRKYKVPVFYV